MVANKLKKKSVTNQPKSIEPQAQNIILRLSHKLIQTKATPPSPRPKITAATKFNSTKKQYFTKTKS